MLFFLFFEQYNTFAFTLRFLQPPFALPFYLWISFEAKGLNLMLQRVSVKFLASLWTPNLFSVTSPFSVCVFKELNTGLRVAVLDWWVYGRNWLQLIETCSCIF